MSQAPQYVRATDFSQDEIDNLGGRSTVRTAQLDAELDSLGTTANAIRTNQSLIQRDDGEIRDGRVKLFTLNTDVLALLAAYGATPRGPWVTATAYAYKDLVSQGGPTYICVVAHTSGTFATDLAAAKWLLFSLSAAPSATQVTFTPTANIAATNAQAAIEESDTENRALSAAASAAAALITSNLASTASTALGDALVGVKKTFTGAVVRTEHQINEEEVWLRDAGCVGNGTTDDTAAFLIACASGRIVDGAGLTYAITGTATVTALKGLRNCTLKQLTPAAATCRTLLLSGCTDFFLENVYIDRNGGTTVGALNTFAGAVLSGCSRFTVDRLEVYNGGPGAGVNFATCTDFEVTRSVVRDMTHNIGAVDDAIQGMWFDACTRFSVVASRVKNLVGQATVRYTRGFTFGGCSDFSVMGNVADGVDQGFDYTGTTGNHSFTHVGNVADNCGTFGHKFANSAYNGVVANCVGRRVGFKAFIVSGQTEVTNPVPRDITFTNCKAIDTGSNGLWGGAQGFRVESVATIDTTYPRNIRFIDCEAIDTQGAPTMSNGFANDVTVLESPTAGYNQLSANIAINCQVRGASSTSFNGIGFVSCTTAGTGTYSLANNDFTVQVDFSATDVYDPIGMHSVASNNSLVFIKVPGVYRLTAKAGFPANATGSRKLRFFLNGGTIAASECLVAAHATGLTYLQGFYELFLNVGDNVGVALYQDSGAAMTVDRALCALTVTQVR